VLERLDPREHLRDRIREREEVRHGFRL
jgi:hypothetical protein